MRGATNLILTNKPNISISIHAPRAGGDDQAKGDLSALAEFQSTPPVRGATVDVIPLYGVWAISIHAPRAGGDKTSRYAKIGGGISIHAPRAGGDVKIRIFIRIFK